MDREEILKQAQSKLPDANQWGMPIVAIHIIKDLPLVVNDEIMPKSSSYYEVRYEKRIDLNYHGIWRLIGIYEY